MLNRKTQRIYSCHLLPLNYNFFPVYQCSSAPNVVLSKVKHVQLPEYIGDWCNHIGAQKVSPFPRFCSESGLVLHLCYVLQQSQAPAGKDNGGLWPAAAHSRARENHIVLDSNTTPLLTQHRPVLTAEKARVYCWLGQNHILYFMFHITKAVWAELYFHSCLGY